MELRELSFATAGELAAAGVTVAIISDHPFLPIQYLPLAGGLAVREGLEAETALRALTLTPAEILGIAGRAGSLEPGKDADLALYRGHPFYDVQARCVLTLVEGRTVHEAGRS
jgi:imidazolonepropionase-like amidohydrolase